MMNLSSYLAPVGHSGCTKTLIGLTEEPCAVRTTGPRATTNQMNFIHHDFLDLLFLLKQGTYVHIYWVRRTTMVTDRVADAQKIHTYVRIDVRRGQDSHKKCRGWIMVL